jgi:hypothetical protein
VSHLHNIAGLAGCAILLAAMAVWLAGRLRLRAAYTALVAAVVAVASLIPLGTLPLAAYVRAFTGDLSMTTLLLLTLFIVGRVRGISINPKEKFVLLGTVAFTALIFYPLALGWGNSIPTGWGMEIFGWFWGLSSSCLSFFRLDSPVFSCWHLLSRYPLPHGEWVTMSRGICGTIC